MKQIVDPLGEIIGVTSSLGKDTQVEIIRNLFTELPMSPMPDNLLPNLQISSQPIGSQATPLETLSKLAGKKIVLLDPLGHDRIRSSLYQASRFQDTLRRTYEV